MSYILRKYAQASYVMFPLIQRDYVDFSGGLSFSAGDVKVSLDRGAFTNVTNLPTDEGFGFYSINLTSGELGCSNLMIVIKDQSDPKLFEDQSLVIDTYGHNSAEHAFDLDSANVSLLSNQNYNNSGTLNRVQVVNSGVTVSDKTGFSLSTSQNYNNAGTLNYVQVVNSGSSSLTASDVWNHGTRTLTDKTGFSLLSNQNFNNSGTQNYVQVLNSGASSLSAADVWSYSTRALTDKTNFSLAANQNFANSGEAGYYGDIEFNPDDSTGRDEYTVRWYKNTQQITAGVTGPTITLLKRSDGTNLFAGQAMTQVGSTAVYKYDATLTNRIARNEQYEVSVTATIDSVSRTWGKFIWR